MDTTQRAGQAADCPLCGELPDEVIVKTGRDQPFPAAFDKLIRVSGEFTSWGDSSLDYRCPDCGAKFVCELHNSFTGSGVNDEAVIMRASVKAATDQASSPSDDRAAAAAAEAERAAVEAAYARMAVTLTAEFKYFRRDTLVLHGTLGRQQVGAGGNVCTLYCDKAIKLPPAEIESIPQIESLRIQFCPALDLAVTFLMLSYLPNLKSLQLKSCGIKELPPEIAALTTVVDFDLGNEGLLDTNEFTTFPPEFASMKRLRSLRLHDNTQFEAFPPEVATMTSLRHINLRGFRRLPKNIELFPNLEDLKLTYSVILPRQVEPLIARPNGLKSVTVGEAYYNMFKELTAEYPNFSVAQEQTSFRGNY